MNTVPVRIARFRTYLDGWHYSDGKAISHLACDLALVLNSYAQELGFTERDVFPLIDGGVMLWLYLPKLRHLEICIYPSGLIEFEEEDGDEQIHSIAGLSLEDVQKKIDGYTWRLSGTTPSSNEPA